MMMIDDDIFIGRGHHIPRRTSPDTPHGNAIKGAKYWLGRYLNVGHNVDASPPK